MLRKGEITYVDGHGGENTQPAPINDKIFIHPFIWPFVAGIGEEVREEVYRTPFNVEIVSDGRIGVMSIPNDQEYKMFRKIANQKLKEYAKGNQ